MNNGDERRAIDGLTTSDDGRTGRTRRFGFGGYSGGVSLRDASASGEVSSEVLDEDVARALRRCAQKSSTSTKVKALRELEESLFDGDEDDGARGGGGARKSVDALAALSRPWARAYDKLAGDGDVGCRREASVLNGRIAVACGKGLGKIGS